MCFPVPLKNILPFAIFPYLCSWVCEREERRGRIRERQTKPERERGSFVQGFPQGEAVMCKILFRTSNCVLLGCTTRAKLFAENQFVNV